MQPFFLISRKYFIFKKFHSLRFFVLHSFPFFFLVLHYAHMQVLHKLPQKNWHLIFLMQVILHDLTKKPINILWPCYKYYNINQTTSVYCQIICRNYKFNPKDPMHILWFSCKYCNGYHITHVVYNSYACIALKTLYWLGFYAWCTKVFQYATNS